MIYGLSEKLTNSYSVYGCGLCAPSVDSEKKGYGRHTEPMYSCQITTYYKGILACSPHTPMSVAYIFKITVI